MNKRSRFSHVETTLARPEPAERVSSGSPPLLRRNAIWEEWEAGRARGKPRKDILLRGLNRGERGLPFQPIKPAA